MKTESLSERRNRYAQIKGKRINDIRQAKLTIYLAEKSIPIWDAMIADIDVQLTEQGVFRHPNSREEGMSNHGYCTVCKQTHDLSTTACPTPTMSENSEKNDRVKMQIEADARLKRVMNQMTNNEQLAFNLSRHCCTCSCHNAPKPQLEGLKEVIAEIEKEKDEYPCDTKDEWYNHGIDKAIEILTNARLFSEGEIRKTLVWAGIARRWRDRILKSLTEPKETK